MCSLWTYKQASTTRHQYIQWTFGWACCWCINALVLSGPIDRLMDWVEKPRELYFLFTNSKRVSHKSAQHCEHYGFRNVLSEFLTTRWELSACSNTLQQFQQHVVNSLVVATCCHKSWRWTLWSLECELYFSKLVHFYLIY